MLLFTASVITYCKWKSCNDRVPNSGCRGTVSSGTSYGRVLIVATVIGVLWKDPKGEVPMGAIINCNDDIEWIGLKE